MGTLICLQMSDRELLLHQMMRHVNVGIRPWRTDVRKHGINFPLRSECCSTRVTVRDTSAGAALMRQCL